jgi:hypothetical protein
LRSTPARRTAAEEASRGSVLERYGKGVFIYEGVNLLTLGNGSEELPKDKKE